MKRTLAYAIAAGTAAALVAGCSSSLNSSGDSPGDPPTPGSTESTAGPSAPSAASDQGVSGVPKSAQAAEEAGQKLPASFTGGVDSCGSSTVEGAETTTLCGPGTVTATYGTKSLELRNAYCRQDPVNKNWTLTAGTTIAADPSAAAKRKTAFLRVQIDTPDATDGSHPAFVEGNDYGTALTGKSATAVLTGGVQAGTVSATLPGGGTLKMSFACSV